MHCTRLTTNNNEGEDDKLWGKLFNFFIATKWENLLGIQRRQMTTRNIIEFLSICDTFESGIKDERQDFVEGQTLSCATVQPSAGLLRFEVMK